MNTKREIYQSTIICIQFFLLWRSEGCCNKNLCLLGNRLGSLVGRDIGNAILGSRISKVTVVMEGRFLLANTVFRHSKVLRCWSVPDIGREWTPEIPYSDLPAFNGLREERLQQICTASAWSPVFITRRTTGSGSVALFGS